MAFFRSPNSVAGIRSARVTTDGHDRYRKAFRSVLGEGDRHRINRRRTRVLSRSCTAISIPQGAWRANLAPQNKSYSLARRLTESFCPVRAQGAGSHARTHEEDWWRRTSAEKRFPLVRIDMPAGGRGLMRVLHASPTWFSPDSVVGGGERWVDNVMLALSAGAPEIKQAMVAIGTQTSLLLRGGCLTRVVRNERVAGEPMNAISSRLWSEFAGFDVVHVHQSLTDFGAYACCVAASLGKTVVLTDLGGGANPVMLQGGLAMADGVVSISKYAHSFVAPLVSAPFIILTGPVDTDSFHPASAAPQEPAAVCVSRIMPHKGIDRIIRALPPTLKLRVVGRVYHEPYRALLGELAKGKDVEFISDPPDGSLVEIYQQSTLFVQASCMRDVYGNVTAKTELMGLTTLEAMACGLPVAVSADGGSLPELVTDARFGAVFNDEAELETILRRHQAGFWPSAGAAAAARAHAVATCGLAAYGRRLAAFYAAAHARRLKGLPCVS
jgi:glycosyltransferase involved in cell wall biosynthesis